MAADTKLAAKAGVFVGDDQRRAVEGVAHSVSHHRAGIIILDMGGTMAAGTGGRRPKGSARYPAGLGAGEGEIVQGRAKLGMDIEVAVGTDVWSAYLRGDHQC